jgi:uroporphyrinogen decarboxylase
VAVNPAIQEALDVDSRGVFAASPPDVATGERSYRDEWGVERVQPPGTLYYDQVSFPLAGPIEISDIVGYSWPDPEDPVRVHGLRDQVRAIRQTTDCAVVLNVPSAFVHASQYLRGFEDWFVDLAADTRLACALFDAVLDINLGVCRAILREVGRDVDVVVASDDLGLQGGLMISPDTYRSLLKPRHERYFRQIHEMSSARLFFHSCGSVVDIIDDLVDIGVEVLNPVQVSAAGMDPAQLKKRFGARLSFWGAVDTQRVLPFGTAEEVRAEVERRVEVLGRDGGYVLAAVHNIQPDVPVDNVLAMYSHARLYSPSWRQ